MASLFRYKSRWKPWLPKEICRLQLQFTIVIVIDRSLIFVRSFAMNFERSCAFPFSNYKMRKFLLPQLKSPRLDRWESRQTRFITPLTLRAVNDFWGWKWVEIHWPTKNRYMYSGGASKNLDYIFGFAWLLKFMSICEIEGCNFFTEVQAGIFLEFLCKENLQAVL